jgi:hypothetical protein
MMCSVTSAVAPSSRPTTTRPPTIALPSPTAIHTVPAALAVIFTVVLSLLRSHARVTPASVSDDEGPKPALAQTTLGSLQMSWPDPETPESNVTVRGRALALHVTLLKPSNPTMYSMLLMHVTR